MRISDWSSDVCSSDLDISDTFDALLNVHGGKVDVRAPQYRSLGMLDPDTGFTAPCAADAVMANQCGNVLGYVSPPRFYDGNYDKSEPLEVGNLGASARFNWDLGGDRKSTRLKSSHQ